MRVLIFFDSYNLGGAEKHALKLADYFRNERKFETEVWVMFEGEGELPVKKFCEAKGIPTRVVGQTFSISPYRFYRHIRHYAPRIKEYGPNVLISFNVIPNLLNGLVKKFCGVKCAVWSQQSTNRYKFDRWVDRWAMKHISCVVSNSHHGLRKLKSDVAIPDEKCFVVPNGIEEVAPQFSRSEWWQKLGVGEADFKAVMTANLHSTKDHITLVKAWKIVVDELARENRKAFLVLPGRKGNTAAEVEAQIALLGISAFVKAIGLIEDVHGLNLAMDLGILSSPAEGLPNGLMENMKAGLAVAGTEIDGIKEVVGQSNYRFLSPVGDAQKMAENILTLARNEALRKETGAANKKRMDEQFTLAKMCSDTEKIIQQFL